MRETKNIRYSGPLLGQRKELRCARRGIDPGDFKNLYDLIQRDPERAWRIVQIMWRHDSSDKNLANIAAGPLEDILVYHGAKFIERIEDIAKKEPTFKKMLGAVSQNDIPQQLW